MKTLRFEGHSDDTFGEYGWSNEDFDNCASERPIICTVQSGKDRLNVIGQYGLDGVAPCWTIGIQLVDEGDELPLWPIRFERCHSYSHALVMDVPDDVELIFWEPKR